MRNCNINKKETSGATTVNTYIGDYTAGLIMDYADEHDKQHKAASASLVKS